MALIISSILQVRIELGIPDHVWQEKRSVIAATIDGLGTKFKPELCAAWLAYIRETYPDGPVAEADSMGEGCWRLMIESLMLLVCISLIPCGGCADWQVFCDEYAPKRRF